MLSFFLYLVPSIHLYCHNAYSVCMCIYVCVYAHVTSVLMRITKWGDHEVNQIELKCQIERENPELTYHIIHICYNKIQNIVQDTGQVLNQLWQIVIKDEITECIGWSWRARKCGQTNIWKVEVINCDQVAGTRGNGTLVMYHWVLICSRQKVGCIL